MMHTLEGVPLAELVGALAGSDMAAPVSWKDTFLKAAQPQLQHMDAETLSGEQYESHRGRYSSMAVPNL